jgi:HD-GYP domain-containing protein (c-di-GMP phosphodiesterase class II)
MNLAEEKWVSSPGRAVPASLAALGRQMDPGRGRMTPVRQFAMLLGVALVVGAVVLGAAIALLLQRNLEDETVRVTQREVEVHFRAVFKGDIFVRPLNPSEAARFDPMVKEHFGIYDIVQLRLYKADGTMVYNYLPGLRPDLPVVDPSFADVPPEHRGHVDQAISGSPSVARTGLSAVDNIRKRDLKDVLVVYVPIRQDGTVIGVAEVYRDIQLQLRQLHTMQALAAGVVACSALLLFVSLIGVFRDSTRRIRRQSEALARSMIDIQATHGATLEALVAALEARDHETEGHSARVTRYAVAIGETLGLDTDQLGALQRGALLHDIGKIGVRDAILRKPGPLDHTEWAQMRQHPEIGSRMVGGIPFLESALPVVRHHHERFDGSGYPDRLRGDDIPLAARVFTVADSFDAMTSDRPYRDGMPIAVAREEILRCAGVQFDPAVVEAFLAIPEDDLAAIRQHRRHVRSDAAVAVASTDDALEPTVREPLPV